ncbi:ABC transporter permease [Chryseolinea sp. H1M3-3]|uniref:ABC transporter permease n=1 Tax=Chryseolinea sp. H1M3-3 TaxID=3034144 RepID=UPI0023ED7BA9|nr:ABC transporter permease [Chryseolinea sp. H1M3-3]
MLRNYIKITSRNLLKNKLFSLINIFGLALGMSCSLLIWLWIQNEKSIDKFHANDAHLYAVVERQFYDGKVEAGYFTPAQLPEALKTTFPEVKFATGMSAAGLNTFEANNKVLKQSGAYGSPDFFSVFSYQLIKGQPETAIKNPGDIIISRKMAENFFGTPEAAMGQVIRFNNKRDFNISAIFENLPPNSSMNFDYILHWEIFMEETSWAKNWKANGPATYIVLRSDANPIEFELKIKEFLDPYLDQKNFVIRLSLQKYSDIYLNSNFKNGENTGGRIQYVRLFTIVAALVLLIACINFMNLTTANSIKRGKEIGVRKVIGARQSGLIRQFMGEALSIVALSFLVSLMIVSLLLPMFNTLTQKQIELPFDQYSFWVGMLFLIILTGILSGSYPALYLSSFKPVTVLKGIPRFSNSALWFRKTLVVFQFTLSTILIIGTIVIARQVDYIHSANLGYDWANLIMVPLEGDLKSKYDLFKKQLTTLSGIELVSSMSDPPTNIFNRTGAVNWEGKDANSKPHFTQIPVGLDFAKTMGVQMLQGRDFSDGDSSDSVSYILNEAALQIVGFEDPIGKPFRFWGKQGKIVGIIKDFHINSLHHAITPTLLHLEEKQRSGWALIRTAPGQTKEVLASVEVLHKKLNPQFPFTFQFLDEEYKKLYGNEQVVQTLSNTFAFLAIFISCIGLLGLAMFTAEQRNKEIGIRKVLGASMASLFGLLSKELFILIAISLMIASPLAWYLMENWLQAYAYHIGIGWWIFLLAGTLTVAIALIPLGIQTFKVLVVNPISSLRSD